MGKICVMLPTSTNLAPLFEIGEGDFKPWPAYMQLDKDGTLHFGRAMDGGITFDVASGLDRRWRIPATLSHAELGDFAKKIRPLLRRVHSGLSVEGNSTNTSLVGKLNTNAERASEAIQHECDALFEKLEWHEIGVNVLRPHEAFEYDDLDEFGLSQDSSDDDIWKVAQELIDLEKQSNNVMIYGDVYVYLKEWIQRGS